MSTLVNYHNRISAHRFSEESSAKNPLGSSSIRHNESMFLCLGGAGCKAGAELVEMRPELRDLIYGLDTDMEIEATLARVTHTHLSVGGNMDVVLANRERYSFLADSAIPNHGLS